MLELGREGVGQLDVHGERHPVDLVLVLLAHSEVLCVVQG